MANEAQAPDRFTVLFTDRAAQHVEAHGLTISTDALALRAFANAAGSSLTTRLTRETSDPASPIALAKPAILIRHADSWFDSTDGHEPVYELVEGETQQLRPATTPHDIEITLNKRWSDNKVRNRIWGALNNPTNPDNVYARKNHRTRKAALLGAGVLVIAGFATSLIAKEVSAPRWALYTIFGLLDTGIILAAATFTASVRPRALFARGLPSGLTVKKQPTS